MFEIGLVIKIISHFNRLSGTLGFLALDSVSKMGPSLSAILFEFQGSKINVLVNLLNWLIMLNTRPISKL